MDLDDYVEKMLDAQRKHGKKREKRFQEKNEAWTNYRAHREVELKNIAERADWLEDLAEIKQINLE